MKEEVLNKLNSIIDDHTKANVGVLIRRIEDLNLPPDKSLSFEQIKTLYVSILKNSLYEQSRHLKKIIKATFEIGTIYFDAKP
jgi:hypothetical protein